MSIKYFFFLFLNLWATALLHPATIGDFRTKASGNWNQVSTWQYYNGSSWVNASWAPTYSDGNIDILSGYSVYVTASLTIDQADVSGSLTVNSGITLTINDGSSTDLSIAGIVYVYGTIVNKGTVTCSSSELVFYSGGLYQHNKDGGTVPSATWNNGSTCEITGVLSSTSLTNTDQSFYHFKWNCPSQSAETNLAGNLEIIRGNLTIVTTGTGRMKMAETADYSLTISGDWIHQNGILNMGGGSSYSYITLLGNFSMSAGKITEMNSSGYTSSITFGKQGIQTFSRSGGQFENTIDFSIGSGTTLDMGSSVVDGSTGTFSVNGGSTLKTAHSGGIANSGASGCIQTTARYYSTGANYHFYANGSQNTGNGLPGSLTGKLFIGSSSSATNLSLTNGSVTIGNTLLLCSSSAANSTIVTGNVFYGSAATLQYQGMSGQNTTVKEWPASSGPPNVIIDNPYGVFLSDDRTVTGTLSLGNGIFSIGPHTLTLNGTLAKTNGSLSGSSYSAIYIGGSSGLALDLPEITLGNLTINRVAGVTTSGDCTIYGTLQLDNGDFTIGSGKTITFYGSPVSGNSQNLKANTSSGMVIAGNASWFLIPSGINQLARLTISNLNGVELSGNIMVNTLLSVQSRLQLHQYQLTGPGTFNILAGSILVTEHPSGISGNLQMTGPGYIDGNVDYEFAGFADQVTGFLPTTPPNTIKNLVIRNLFPFTVYINSDITMTGILRILSGSTLNILPGISVEAGADIFIH